MTLPFRNFFKLAFKENLGVGQKSTFLDCLMETSLIAIVASIGLILLSAIIGGVIFLKKGKKENTVFLVGLSGSGKTTLFYYLIAKQNTPTITSQIPNEYDIVKSNKRMHLVDLPGHPRIRTEVMNRLKEATGIIFTIDSETVLKNMSDIANFLYDILSDTTIIQNKVPFLILATKSDIKGSRDIDLIQQELEKELDFIRSNRFTANYVEHGESEQLFLGEEGKEFTFAQLTNNVSFQTCSVIHKDIISVTTFLNSLF